MPRRSRAATQPDPLPGSSSRQSLYDESSSVNNTFDTSQKSSKDTDNVNNLVRYILYRAGDKVPIKKADILKYVMPGSGRGFEKILPHAVEILNAIYGYELYTDNSTTKKSYLIKNTLTPLENDRETNKDDFKKVEEHQQILTMLILAHIFLTNTPVNEASIIGFLNALKIDWDRTHRLFGNVRELITSTMVKEGYLIATIDKKNAVFYEWGVRADKEVSKRQLLEFVCNIYKDRTPQSWKILYKSIANDVEEMEVVEEVDSNSGSDSD